MTTFSEWVAKRIRSAVPALIALAFLGPLNIANAQYGDSPNADYGVPYGYDDSPAKLDWGFPGESGNNNEFDAMAQAAFYEEFGPPVAFTLPLPPTTPEDINKEGNNDKDTTNPGTVEVPDDCKGETGLEAEHTDSPPGVFAPSVPGTYPVDFVYFPPNDDYPTGCVKVPDGTRVRIRKRPDGTIVPEEVKYGQTVPGGPGFEYWVPVDEYGWPGLSPGTVNPADKGQPLNGFPSKKKMLAEPAEDAAL